MTSSRACHTRLLLLGLLLITGACDGGGGGGTPVDPGPEAPRLGSLSVVAGRGQADTVDSTLPQPLVVEVRDTKGVPMADVEITIFSMAAGNPPPRVLFAAPGNSFATPSFSGRTSADGRFSVQMRLGTTAGSAAVVAQTGMLTDTATVVIQTGNPVRIEASPADTTLYAPAVYKLQATARDRHRNAIPASRTGVRGVSLDGEMVRMTEIGRGHVVLQAGSVVDSARVSVVPRGTVVLTHYREESDAIVTMELDGSAYRVVTSASKGVLTYAPVWSPDGNRILYHTGHTTGSLWIRRATGEFEGPVAPAHADSSAMWGDWRNPEWIYYSGSRGVQYGIPDRGFIFRVRSDGTGTERMTTASAQEWHRRPRVSVDGRYLVYARVSSGGIPFADATGALTRVDLATGTVTDLGVASLEGRWSPSGDHIAATSGGALLLIARDGSTRTLAGGVHGPADWSPDGNFILSTCGERLCIVVVASGEKIPLSFTDRRYIEPAWKW